MYRDLRSGVLTTFGILILGIFSGCTPDDEYEESTDLLYPEEYYYGPPPATMVAVTPLPRATLAPDQVFQLEFDQGVTWVSVNGAAAIGSSTNWTASPAFSEGVVILYVSWENRDGSRGCQEVGPYFFRNLDVTRPVIAGGTVRDSERNVDPAQINAVGFRLDFSEVVTGTVKLTDEAGNNLNWIANIVDWTVTLTPVAGQELVHSTVYVIDIDGVDGAGNRTQATNTFITKPK